MVLRYKIAVCLSAERTEIFHQHLPLSPTDLFPMFTVPLHALYLQTKLLSLLSLQQASQQRWLCPLSPSTLLTVSAGSSCCPGAGGASWPLWAALPGQSLPTPSCPARNAHTVASTLCEGWLVSLLLEKQHLLLFSDFYLLILPTFLAVALAVSERDS